jgi:hypothetical protein
MELTRFDVEFCVEEVDWDVNGLQKVEQLIWRFKGPSEIIVVVVLRLAWKFLSLRVEAFHNSIALTDHVVVFAPISDEGKNNSKAFSVGLGPGGARQAFLFHCNTWTDIFFFINTNCLLLILWERDAHREPVVATCEDWKTKICTLKILWGLKTESSWDC